MQIAISLLLCSSQWKGTHAENQAPGDPFLIAYSKNMLSFSFPVVDMFLKQWTTLYQDITARQDSLFIFPICQTEELLKKITAGSFYFRSVTSIKKQSRCSRCKLQNSRLLLLSSLCNKPTTLTIIL